MSGFSRRLPELKEYMIKDKILRMIDASLNRATEGLRVAEDVVRFILDDDKLTLKLKDIRHQITKHLKDVRGEMRGARDVKHDVGAGRSTKSEGRRKNILDVFLANIKRAEESVRVFEEISKLFDPKLGPKFKKLRFEVYDIEQQAAKKLKKKTKLDFNLYVITDPSFGRSHLDIMKEAVKPFDCAQGKGGVLAVQLRDKKMSKSEYLKTARAMSEWAKKHGVTFIVNDSFDIAGKSDADGVHVGQDIGESGYQEIKKLKKIGKIVGISASNIKEAIKAQRLGADYIGFGPVFGTPIKPGLKPLGIKALKGVMKRVTIPVVAIGGINRSNIGQIRAAGCDRVAVIRAVSGAKNVAIAAKKLMGMFNDKCQMTKLK